MNASTASCDKAIPVNSEKSRAAWSKFIEYCEQNIADGWIENLKIENGVPVLADVVHASVKF